MKILFSLLVMSALSLSLFAQAPQQQQPQQQQQMQMGGDMEEVSDRELKKFVNVQEMIQEKNQEAQPKMIEIIEENEFEIQRFVELSQATETGAEVNASEEEMARFSEAQEGINTMQREANEEIANGIEDMGLSLERYNEISIAIQQSPQLQQKLQDLR